MTFHDEGVLNEKVHVKQHILSQRLIFSLIQHLNLCTSSYDYKSPIQLSFFLLKGDLFFHLVFLTTYRLCLKKLYLLFLIPFIYQLFLIFFSIFLCVQIKIFAIYLYFVSILLSITFKKNLFLLSYALLHLYTDFLFLFSNICFLFSIASVIQDSFEIRNCSIIRLFNLKRCRDFKFSTLLILMLIFLIFFLTTKYPFIYSFFFFHCIIPLLFYLNLQLVK